MKLKVGDSSSSERRFSFETVNAFAELSGDQNPVHLNPEFAAQTIFNKPIVHGFLFASMISELIANKLPGPGSIYIHQDMQFKSPVFHDELLQATVTIEEIKETKSIFILRTVIVKNTDEIVLDGKAVIKLII